MNVHIKTFGPGININTATKKDLLALPHRQWGQDVSGVSSLVIIPGTKGQMHDSGYRCMTYVGCHLGEAFVRLGGSSDVLHIGGIGGYNNVVWYKDGGVPIRAAWSIDSLPISGLLHLFCDAGELTVGQDLSSFEVWSGKQKYEAE